MPTKNSKLGSAGIRKPYWDIPIDESKDPLVHIPEDQFVCATPHPYAVLGAPYGNASPFFLRQEVLTALSRAQQTLQEHHPAWKLFIFDAYRPVAVQQFMVDFTFDQAIQDRHLDRAQLSAAQTAALWQEVFQLWAPPVLDPATPPPHSTGAAVDVTLFDTDSSQTVEMGSPIDELSERTQPNYFETVAADPNQSEQVQAEAALAHQHRELLRTTMESAGFSRHLGEWWHFSLGDQMWAWLGQQQQPELTWTARYGRA